MKKTQSQQPRPLPNHHTSTPSAESVASFKNARLTASLISSSNSPHPSGFQSGVSACSNFKENILSTSSPHRQIVIPAAGRLHRKPPLSTALTASNGPTQPINGTASALSLTGGAGGHKHPPTTTAATKSARASFFKSVISYCSPASSSQPQTTRKSPTPQPQAGRQGLLSSSKTRQCKSKTASSGRLLTLDDSDVKNERRQTPSVASLQCAICFEQYCSSMDGNRETRRPRILPLCGHSICSECLLRAISISLRDGTGLHCHICKKEIPHDILKQSTMTRSKREKGSLSPPSLQGFPVNWSLAELAQQQQSEKKVRQWHTPSALHVEVPGLNQVKGDALMDHTFSPLNRHPGDPGEHAGQGDIDQERSTKGSSNYKFQERKSADDGMRGTVDSFLARRSEGAQHHPLLSLRSMCFSCRGQNADTHFCRAHLLKFCSQCALKHLKSHGECEAANIIEVGHFDDYSQEVKQRASQFRNKLEDWEVSLQNQKTEIASQIQDKLDSLIEMLAQMKRDVRQHYDLRSYILIQYGERVQKALKNLNEINTHDLDTFNFQKMRDAALRMNRLGEVMAEAETLLENHVNITNALHFSAQNYQQLQLALVELISKEDLSSFVGLGGIDPKTPLNPLSRNRPMVFSRTAPSRKDENEQQQKEDHPHFGRSGGVVGAESESDFTKHYPKTAHPTAHPSLHTSPYPRHLQLSEKRRVLNEIEQNENREAGGDQLFGKIELGDKKGCLFQESMVPRKELFEACALGYLRSVEFLLDNFDFPGGINVRDATGCTPFLRAAQAQQSEVYQALVRRYFSNVNVQDHNGRTALIHAAMTNDLELGRFLVEECKANTNLQTKWKDTALHFAVSHDNETMVRLLMEGGANCKIPNSEGRPPLAKSESVRSLLLL